MRRLSTILSAVCLSVLLLEGCKKDYFDKDNYTALLEATFGVDNIDRQHDWTLTRSSSLTLSAHVEGVGRLQLLTANPYSSDEAEIMAETTATRGERKTLVFTIPTALTTLWAAALSPDGTRCLAIKEVAATEATAYLDETSRTTNEAYTHEPLPQTLVYCFEKDFPVPGDNDFNDVVLRVSRNHIAERALADPAAAVIDVELSAVGCMQQVAAAIGLNATPRSTLQSVTLIGDNLFRPHPEADYQLLPTDQLLTTGLDKQAVITLFDDAHMVFFPELNRIGAPTRYCANTMLERDDAARSVEPVKVSLLLKFYQQRKADELLLSDLDPFILADYNSVVREIHTFPNKLRETLLRYYKGHASDYDNQFAWALCVPYASFRHPIEGMPIGSLQGSLTNGAYPVPRHSFAEWMKDRYAATDWYRFADRLSVYQK